MRFFLLLFFLPNYLSAQAPFDLSKVQQLYIDFHDSNWENKLKAYKQLGSEKRLSARLRLGTMQFDSVGVRFKGNSSYNNPRKKENRKLPFNIDINEYDKKAKLSDGTKKIKLSNSFRDPTYMREVLTYAIMGDYLSVPETGFYQLFINGDDYGIYIGTDSVNKQFLKKHFGTKKGILVKCDADFDKKDEKTCSTEQLSNLQYFEDPECYLNRYELKSKKGWVHFNALIDSLNNQPAGIDQQLNIYETLWMHALNSVLVNLDSYIGRLSHNYYLYQDTFKVWHPIVWDMNLSFGGFAFDGIKNGILTAEEMMNYSIFAHLDNTARPLIHHLLKKSLYRKIYVHMVKTICEDHFINGAYKSKMSAYRNVLEPAVNRTSKHLYPSKLFSENLKSTVKVGKVSMIGLEELMEGRMAYLKTTPVFGLNQPELIHHQQDTLNGQWQLKFEATNCDKVYFCSRQVANGPWKLLEIDGSAEAPPISLLMEERPHSFFLLLENDKHLSLFPRNAPQNHLTPDQY